MSPSLKRRRSELSTGNAPPPAATAPVEPSPTQTPAPPKRQRVSRACDQCRAAREKCDGVQPQCYSCTSLSRPCTYTIAPKKRGVQTGLIRTLELTLAWVFENVAGSEDALAALLSNESRRASGLLLDKGNEEGIRLHKRWRKSRIHRGIDRLLSEKDGAPPRVTESPADSDGDMQTSVPDRNTEDRDIHPAGPAGPPRAAGSITPAAVVNLPGPTTLASNGKSCLPRVSLPKNYQRLLDVYNSYTTCWLPILDQAILLKTASIYPSDGLILESQLPSIGAHAELWAALALASFQNAHSSIEHPGEIPASDVYAVARALIPSSEHTNLTKSHLKALLLLSLVQFGKQNTHAASHLVGMAVRLALQMRLGAHTEQVNSQTSQDQLLLAVCFSLDTLLGQLSVQPSHLTRHTVMPHIAASQDNSAEWAHWLPCTGFGFSEPGNSNLCPKQSVQPTKCFDQLFQFFRVLSQQSDLHSRLPKDGSEGGTGDLVRCLAPEYSFCNSLVGSQVTASIPSAYFVQAAFLSASLVLSPNGASSRVSLLWGLMEVIETFISRFGACGTPPLLVSFMRLAANEGRLDCLQENDKRRWGSLSRVLGSIWSSAGGGDRPSTQPQPQSQPQPAQQEHIQERNHQTRPTPAQGQAIVQQPLPPLIDDRTRIPFLNTHHPGPIPPTNPRFGSYPMPQTSNIGHESQPSSMLPYHGPMHLGNPGNIPRNMVPGTNGQRMMDHGMHNATTLGMQNRQHDSNKGLDYDAMLDELAAADCNDTLETDPAFMTNLGFAPGYDLDEFLRKGFGSF
ncbi:hypothetical protein MCOR02_009425 [Pyricularia oryzae]|nr:hypothetical protein MCOR02_009425 [Pyricularia oryzae]KAI6311151.1 hypothetical protein MCOR34_006143 [Pyricularia oryzae]KAI6454378.1 hypothetical protein MCOR15_008251 [Pyricularia oryzae]KAI6460914.1 hypothetical protein MCOR17_006532 [Pyricularia oryzae]KAI6502133.1 hypothetical protein MCOR13_005480 [Pyricularia oryzae]